MPQISQICLKSYFAVDQLSKENMITFQNKIVLGIIQPKHKRTDKMQN